MCFVAVSVVVHPHTRAGRMKSSAPLTFTHARTSEHYASRSPHTRPAHPVVPVRCIAQCSSASSYAFVEFRSSRDADDAHYEMHGHYFEGSRLRVQWAKHPPSAAWRPERRSPPPRRRSDRDRSRSPRRDRDRDSRRRSRSRSRSPTRRSQSPDRERRKDDRESDRDRENGRDDDRERQRDSKSEEPAPANGHASPEPVKENSPSPA